MEQTSTAAALTPPPAPGHGRTQWAKFRHSTDKAGHISARDRCLSIAAHCRKQYAKAYRAAARKHGEGRTLGAPTPGALIVERSAWISGGTWEHWPREAKDKVARWSRTAHVWDDLARHHHRAAGLMRWTFPANN